MNFPPKNQIQQFQYHLNQLSRLLLVNSLCQNVNQSDNNSNSHKFMNKQIQKDFTQSFINPFILPMNDKFKESKGSQQNIVLCQQNRELYKKSNNFQMLLRSVKIMPKLRYQQSQKIFKNFQLQKQGNEDLQKQFFKKTPFKQRFSQIDQNNQNTINFSKSIQNSANKFYQIKKNIQQKQRKWKQSSSTKFQASINKFSTIKKYLTSQKIQPQCNITPLNLQQEEQDEIISMLSPGITGKTYRKNYQNHYKQISVEEQNTIYTEKQMIFNYFGSAKQKVEQINNYQSQNQRDKNLNNFGKINCWNC